VVTLGAVHDLALKAGRHLTSEDYDRLIETFHRHMGARVVTAWALPSPVLTVISQWETYEWAGAARIESNIVNVAHRLADWTLLQPTAFVREVLAVEPAFLALGLDEDDAGRVCAAAPATHAELDRYLAPN